MLLSARPLENVVNVNAYEVVDHVSFSEGDAVSLYLQLVDLAKDRPEQGFVPAGRRYMPAAGATLQVTLDHLNDARVITKVAVQPFSQDASIWRVDVMSTDIVRGTVTIKIALTENGTIRRGVMDSVLRVQIA